MCLEDLCNCMAENLLKLNCDKTEVMYFVPNRNSGTQVRTTIVKNLGVQMDPKLNMERHINAIAHSCYGQLRNISHIRRLLTTNAVKTLIHGLVTSRLDYCKALLSGCTKKCTKQLQRVQNTAARIITRTRKYDHITPD